MAQRFVQIADVAETLNVSARQVYGLVKSGELPAIKINNQWRVEAAEVERTSNAPTPQRDPPSPPAEWARTSEGSTFVHARLTTCSGGRREV